MADGTGSSPLHGERAFVFALALVAVLRVLLFAAAFPFFANVDEHRHVDMVLKYARGYASRPGSEAYEPQMPALLALHGSPEYTLAARAETPLPPPVWESPPGEMVRRTRANRRFLSAGPNIEAHQPPAYYLTAGVWRAGARLLGFDSGASLYWIRALNALFVAGLLVCAYALLRETHADDPLVRLGVPALLACFPQDAFYYVTGDALSPLVCGLGFALLVRITLQPGRGALSHAAAGAAVAVGFLTKYTNLALLCVAALCTVWILCRHPSSRRWPGIAKPLLLWIASLGPIASWLARNRILFGDATATALKVEVLGWGHRPLAEWLGHPLFSPGGAVEFAWGLLPTFWRGELVWHREILASLPADVFYAVGSFVFVTLAACALRRGPGADESWLVEAASLSALLLYVGVLAVLSLAFVFHEHSNPPADFPYFTQGRLVAGAILPFCVLYVCGIRTACSPLSPRARMPAAVALLAFTAAVAVVSEVALSRDVFASAYNFYHLP